MSDKKHVSKKRAAANGRPSPASCSVLSVKPPLGIMPERIWKEHRAWELMKCIVRHESQPTIPGEWWDELRRLLTELGTPNSVHHMTSLGGTMSEETK